MNREMHGKKIKQIYFDDQSVIVANGAILTLSATHHGDRDEFWVIVEKDSQEIARHNCKYIASIKWLLDE